MKQHTERNAIAIVGLGAVLPDADDVGQFWNNLSAGRYSIGDVPADRWSTDLYYDADPSAPDKAYSKIGGFVRDLKWEPLKWRLPIPPKVAGAMDRAQKYGIIAVREAVAHYGKELDRARTAVIFGSAMGGDRHYQTSARIMFPEFAASLAGTDSFDALPADTRADLLREMAAKVAERFPQISEDTMPGELANIIAGRVAALFDFKGPNFTTDAACASAMAAMNAAVEGLVEGDFDSVLTGGVDANMSPTSYIKFCKIGALSATGTRPFDAGADGFVMGEGAAVFLLRRLEDAERDGDDIYAVIRGFGASSDGKGKGITAPNPAGQRLAVQRAWENAGVSPQSCTMMEAHGTSTRVGDVVETDTLATVFADFGLPLASVSLGSVKSNIGHLKAAAGAAGVLKSTLALHHKQLPPSLGFQTPNPKISWSASPFAVNTEHRPWDHTVDGIRRAGISSFGFGGTNFHAVLEEYIPGRIADQRRRQVAMRDAALTPPTAMTSAAATTPAAPVAAKTPPRGLVVLLAALAIFVPLLLIFYQSFLSAPFFAPVKTLTFDSYRFIFDDPDFRQAFVNGVGRHGDALAQFRGFAGDDQGGGGIKQHGVAIGTGGALQQSVQGGGIFLRLAALQILQCGQGQAGLIGRDLEFGNLAIFKRDDVGWPGCRDFVRAVGTVDHPDPLGTKGFQGFGHGPQPFPGENADQLQLHIGRIGHRPENIEDRPRAHLDPRRAHIAHGAVMAGGRHEADAGLVQGGL